MKITRLFFESAGGNTDTYINGLVSWERAVNLAKQIQACSALDLVRIWRSEAATVAGTLDPASDRRRVFTFTDTPQEENVNFSAYKTGSDGFGVGVYLQLFIRDVKGDNHFLTVPNPLRMLDGDSSQVWFLLNGVKNAYLQGLDIKEGYSRKSGSWRFLYPNFERRMLDDYRKEHPGTI